MKLHIKPGDEMIDESVMISRSWVFGDCCNSDKIHVCTAVSGDIVLWNTQCACPWEKEYELEISLNLICNSVWWFRHQLYFIFVKLSITTSRHMSMHVLVQNQ